MATQAAFLVKFPQLALSAQPSRGQSWVAVAAGKVAAPRGVRCRAGGLIEPDGGRLMELVAPEQGGRRAALRREAAALPHRVRLGRVETEWVHVLSEGWASPLRGFMRESEFLQALHFNAVRGDDGKLVNMSVPIVLAVDDAQRRAIEASGATRVALVDDHDRPVAVLSE